MKAVVGFGFFLLFLAGIALVTLQGRQLAQQGLAGGGTGITGIDWRPTVVGTESIPDDTGMFVQFEVDGSFKGNGGCNAFTGSLEQSDSGVVVGPISATRMACPEPAMQRETAFMEALQGTIQLEAAGNRLQLLGESRILLAELVREG